MDSRLFNTTSQLNQDEYVIYLSQVGFVDPASVRLMFSSTGLTDRPNSTHEITNEIVLAKLYELEGNFEDAAQIFNRLQKQLTNSEVTKQLPDSVLAFFYLEYSGFLYLVKNRALRDIYVAKFGELATNEKFQRIHTYKQLLPGVESGRSSRLGDFKAVLDYLSKAGLPLLANKGIQRLGHYYTAIGDFDAALEQYLTALHMAEEEGYRYQVQCIQNSLGLFYQKQGKLDQAIKHYEGLLQQDVVPYYRVKYKRNLSAMYYLKRDYSPCLKTAEQALQDAIAIRLLPDVPVLAKYVGDLHREVFNDPKTAYALYRSIPGHIQKLQQAGLPVAAAHEKVQRDLINTLMDVVDPLEIEASSPFSFAADLTWNELKDVLTLNIFLYHYAHTGIGHATFQHLEISSSTFHTALKRLQARGFSFPNFRRGARATESSHYVEGLQQLISTHRDLPFKRVYAHLEKKALEHLYALAGYNKSRLAKRLDTSYSVILEHTRFLTH